MVHQFKKNILILVCPQKDFCEGGNLYLEGCEANMERIAKFINLMGNRIKEILVVLDQHPVKHITFNTMWKYSNGETVKPYTPILKTLDNDFYVNQYPVKCIFTNSIPSWKPQTEMLVVPPHCIKGSQLSTIHPSIFKSLYTWSVNSRTKWKIIYKNSDPIINDNFTQSNGLSNLALNITSQFLDQINLKEIDSLLLTGPSYDKCLCGLTNQLNKYINQDKKEKKGEEGEEEEGEEEREEGEGEDKKGKSYISVNILTDLVTYGRNYRTLEPLNYFKYDIVLPNILSEYVLTQTQNKTQKHLQFLEKMFLLSELVMTKTKYKDVPTSIVATTKFGQTISPNTVLSDRIDFTSSSVFIQSVSNKSLNNIEKGTFVDSINREKYENEVLKNRTSVMISNWLLDYKPIPPPLNNIFLGNNVENGRGMFPRYGANHAQCVVIQNDDKLYFYPLRDVSNETMWYYYFDQTPTKLSSNFVGEGTKVQFSFTSFVPTPFMLRHAWLEINFVVLNKMYMPQLKPVELYDWEYDTFLGVYELNKGVTF